MERKIKLERREGTATEVGVKMKQRKNEIAESTKSVFKVVKVFIRY